MKMQLSLRQLVYKALEAGFGLVFDCSAPLP